MWKVFVDIDGVLTDFVGDAAWLFSESREDIYNEWKAGEYRVWKVLGVTEGEFWDRIAKTRTRFWAEMTLYPKSIDLLNWLKDMNRQKHLKLYLLTAVSDIPVSYLGRVFWIRHHMGVSFKDFIFTKDKYLLAGEKRLLIDDFPEQCSRFKDSDGESILYRRPWNSDKEHCDKEAKFYIKQIKRKIGGDNEKQMELFAD